jgi:alanine dehydrogenase
MVIGIPKERKVHEYRVAATPHTVRVLAGRGHKVLVEKGAGTGCAISDGEFERAGAELVATEEELFSRAELIVKVKEPQREEYHLLEPRHTLFCYVHLAPNEELKRALIESGSRVIAFETVELDDGSLPLLIPMSTIAGRLSAQIGAYYLQKPQGGKGILLGGSPGVRRGRVVILGGGTVGYNAALSAMGLGAEVTIIEKADERLRFFHDRFGGVVRTVPSYPETIEKAVVEADLVVGAVYVTGARAPRLISSDVISRMEEGSVLVDVAIDQGGCSETSRTTTLDSPTYRVGGVTHYCVANMPSLVCRTATFSLSNAILPYVIKIAEGEVDATPALRRGINVEGGRLMLRTG